MRYEKFKTDLISIHPGLECLEFLAWRVGLDGYRGAHYFQHYRWDLDYIKIVLKNLKKYGMLLHTQGDIHKEYRYKSQEQKWAKFVANTDRDLRQINKSITDNGMRKIIFVNLQRLGLIHRFNKRKELCPVNKKAQYLYAQISQDGINLLEAKNIFDELKILGLAIDTYCGGLVQSILDCINSLEKAYIGNIEFTLFASFLGNTWKGQILSVDKITEFIEEFRSLNARQETVVKCVREYCDPKKFNGDKTQKRDFHNWQNETDSIFNTFALISLFEHDENSERLMLKGEIKGEAVKFKRSMVVKNEYFKYHEVEKDIQFELHHIVPFYSVNDIDMLKAIDNWQNLLYIDANSHKILSLDKEAKMAIKLDFDGQDVLLDNLLGFVKTLKFNENVRYKSSLQEKMKAYNKKLL